jgi:hypothetical protein
MKHHTFKVNCGFTMQYTFDETEIGSDGEPTAEGLLALEGELEHHLQKNFSVDFVEAEADFLIGVADDSDGGLLQSHIRCAP